MIDHVLNWLKKNDAPTVEAYCELNYGMSWDELRRGEYPEWEAEVLDLISDGELKVSTPGSRKIQ